VTLGLGLVGSVIAGHRALAEDDGCAAPTQCIKYTVRLGNPDVVDKHESPDISSRLTPERAKADAEANRYDTQGKSYFSGQ
jgi:hypothetical protein